MPMHQFDFNFPMVLVSAVLKLVLLRHELVELLRHFFILLFDIAPLVLVSILGSTTLQEIEGRVLPSQLISSFISQIYISFRVLVSHFSCQDLSLGSGSWVVISPALLHARFAPSTFSTTKLTTLGKQGTLSFPI